MEITKTYIPPHKLSDDEIKLIYIKCYFKTIDSIRTAENCQFFLYADTLYKNHKNKWTSNVLDFREKLLKDADFISTNSNLSEKIKRSQLLSLEEQSFECEKFAKDIKELYANKDNIVIKPSQNTVFNRNIDADALKKNYLLIFFGNISSMKLNFLFNNIEDIILRESKSNEILYNLQNYTLTEVEKVRNMKFLNIYNDSLLNLSSKTLKMMKIYSQISEDTPVHM